MSKTELLTNNLKNMKGFHPDVDVVKDLPYREDYINNSFFAIGHFKADGDVIDYLYHIMSYAFPGKEPEFTYCFSVTNETTKEYYQYSHAYKESEIKVSKDTYFIETPVGTMSGTLDCMKLTAKIKNAALDLELKSIGYPIYNGGTSLFHMVGMDIYEYSIPTMLSNGTVTIGSKTFTVKDGISWYDRQWQQKLPKVPDFVMNGMAKVMEKKNAKEGGFVLPVWGWMDINLENEVKISTWFAIEDGKENCWATIMHPDGSQRTVDVNPVVCQATDHWKSEQSGASYPMTYKIQIPELDTDLVVKCVVDDQELYFPENAIYNHYEGASSVEGIYQNQPVKGYCYTELIGDWSK